MSSEIARAVGALQISATAKLVGIATLTSGVRKVSELAELIGLPKSTVYRAQGEFIGAGGEEILTRLSSLTIPTVLTSEIPTQSTDEKQTEKTVSLVSPVRNSEPVPSCAGATKELPSEVVIPKLDSPSSVPPKPISAIAKPKSVSEKPKSVSARGARLQADWVLSVEWRQWARLHFAHASDEMVTAEAEKFRDFWIAKAGQAASKLDWFATWRNWCRTAFAAKPSAQPMNWGRASWEEQKAAKHEATRQLLRDLGYRSEAVQ